MFRLKRTLGLILTLCVVTYVLLFTRVFKIAHSVTLQDKVTLTQGNVGLHSFRNLHEKSTDEDIVSMEHLESLTKDKATGRYLRPVFFLKTHKTGSSTVQSILMRYADSHNLTLALPDKKLFQYNYWTKFSNESMIPLNDRSDHYDVMCHHMVYSNEVQKIMPPQTYYLSILREPSQLYISSYIFFGMGNGACNSTVNKFIEEKVPDEVPLIHDYQPPDRKCRPNHWIRHGLFYDFGYEYAELDDLNSVTKIIEEIDERYDFIMLLEYFDECLVLLRDELGWSTYDILYFAQNSIQKNEKHDHKKFVSDKAKTKLKRFLEQEYMLYSHFLKSYTSRVNAYGSNKLKLEVDKFRLIRKMYEYKCLSGTEPKAAFDDRRSHDILMRPCCDTVPGFKLRNDVKSNWMCRRLAASEWPYTLLLRQKMIRLGRYSEKYHGPLQSTPEEYL